MKLECQLCFFGVTNYKYVALLADADLPSDLCDRATLQEGTEGQEVVPRCRQPKTVIHALLVDDQDVAQELADNLVRATTPNVGDCCNKLERDELVVSHAHLHRKQDTEVVPRHVPQALHVELHGGGANAKGRTREKTIFQSPSANHPIGVEDKRGRQDNSNQQKVPVRNLSDDPDQELSVPVSKFVAVGVTISQSSFPMAAHYLSVDVQCVHVHDPVHVFGAEACVEFKAYCGGTWREVLAGEKLLSLRARLQGYAAFCCRYQTTETAREKQPRRAHTSGSRRVYVVSVRPNPMRR